MSRLESNGVILGHTVKVDYSKLDLQTKFVVRIKANTELVEKLGGKVVGIGFLIELGYLHGREALGNKYDVFSLTTFKTTTG